MNKKLGICFLSLIYFIGYLWLASIVISWIQMGWSSIGNLGLWQIVSMFLYVTAGMYLEFNALAIILFFGLTWNSWDANLNLKGI